MHPIMTMATTGDRCCERVRQTRAPGSAPQPGGRLRHRHRPGVPGQSVGAARVPALATGQRGAVAVVSTVPPQACRLLGPWHCARRLSVGKLADARRRSPSAARPRRRSHEWPASPRVGRSASGRSCAGSVNGLPDGRRIHATLACRTSGLTCQSPTSRIRGPHVLFVQRGRQSPGRLPWRPSDRRREQPGRGRPV